MTKEKQKNESETTNGTDISTVTAVENNEKESISQAKKRLSTSNLIKEFENDQIAKTDKYYRYWNEAPTLTMIAIVILAVAEPF